MNELKIFYAVNRSGQGMVFTDCPYRDEHRRIWVGAINVAVVRFIDCLETDYKFPLPDITWEDDPVELKISFSYGE